MNLGFRADSKNDLVISAIATESVVLKSSDDFKVSVQQRQPPFVRCFDGVGFLGLAAKDHHRGSL